MAPVLRDATVSQGIGTSSTAPGYRYLRRGKTTIVEAAISKPLCAEGRPERVTVRSATLEVSFPGRDLGQQLQNTITGPVFPELPNFSAAPTPNAPANPKFAVPGSALDSPTTGRVTASFTITVQYEVSTLPGVLQTATLRPNGALTGPTVTAQYERHSNSMNLLVLVLGNPEKGFASAWPGRTAPSRADGADDVLLRALQAASRLGPFKDGVANTLAVKNPDGTLTAPDAGLRYAVAPTVVDVRSALRTSDGKFCGTSDNFTYLRSQMSSFFNNWQSQNAGVLVDKVVGLVWGPNSIGPATDASCAEGYATIGGNQSWSRLVPDVLDSEGTVGVPSNGGNLITMETVGHNLGSVPQSRSASGDVHHSVSTAAAGARGVNIATRAPIPDAVSPLKYSTTGWDDYSTLLRREDYAYTLCRLTKDSDDFCPVDTVSLNRNTTPVGSAATLTPSVFTMAGTTDGTSQRTDIDTYLSSDTDVSDVPESSDFVLVQRGSAASGEPILRSTPFPVDFRTSEHHAGGPHEHPTAAVGTLEVRFAADPAAQVFEVYKGDPRKTRPIYRRARDGAPVLDDASLTPGIGRLDSQTADVAGGTEPALSRDGQLLVYTAPGSRLVVKDLRSGGRSTEDVAGSAATWVDDDTLALVRDGSIYLRDVTRTSAGAPSIAPTERIVYDAAQQVELLFGRAGEPTAHATGTNLVTSINGDLWRIDLAQAPLPPNGVVCRLENPTIAPCHRITRDEESTDTAPSYDTDGRVLFVRSEGGSSALRALDTSGRLQSRAIPGARTPSASAPMVAYATKGGLALAASSNFEIQNSALTSGADEAPSLVGNTLAFARVGASRTDVITTRWTNKLSFSARDAVPGRLRANVFATCDGIHYPIFAATPPTGIVGDLASWQLDWDGIGSTCTRPDVYALVNDGIDSVRIDLGQGYGPAVEPVGGVGAIYAPAPGARILQYDSVALLGDVPGVPEQQLAWRVRGPGYDNGLAFSRAASALALPDAGGWQPGALYTVQLRRGAAVLASGAFRATADADHDNIPRDVELCLGASADEDPTNAWGDADGDGERNFPDPDPCNSSLNVTVDMDANTLNTTSSGNNVTFYLTRSGVDLREVPMASIAVTSVGGLDADLRATAFESVTKDSAVVKVSRQELNDFAKRHGIKGRVAVVVAGSGPDGAFRGFDPNDPTFS